MTSDGYYTEQVHGPMEYLDLGNFELALAAPAPGREAGRLHQLPGLGGGLDGRDDHAVDPGVQHARQLR